MTLLDLPHGKTQTMNLKNSTQRIEQHTSHNRLGKGKRMRLDPTGNERSLLLPGIEEADKLKPTTSRPPALHLRFYSSVSVWRGTEGGGGGRAQKTTSRPGLPNAEQ